MTPDLPRRPLRVLHLTISFARGGRRDAIVTLARSTRSLEVVPYLGTLRGERDDAEPFAEAFEGIRNFGIRGRPSRREVHALRDQCLEWGIQVVHAHDASSQFVASMLRLVAPKLRVVMTFHRSLAFESVGWRNRLRNATSLTLVSRVLTASEERRQHFLSENLVRTRKVETIPLGIDLYRFRPDADARRSIRAELGIQDHELLLVAAGHFGEEKGIDLLLRAVGSAFRNLPRAAARLAVMGTGDSARIDAIQAIGAAELGDRVIFLGQRSDPERLFAAADLVVHTPRLEAFGLVVVQAMASGAAVVASRVGGLPEIVRDGVTGLLAPPQDPTGTGELIGALLEDGPRRQELAQAGLARARQEFAAERFATRHRALYDAIVPGS